MDDKPQFTLRQAAQLLKVYPPANWMEALWRVYLEAIVPKHATQSQITECKRAFFAGGRALFELQTGVFAEMTDDDAERAMQKVSDELKAFSQHPF